MKSTTHQLPIYSRAWNALKQFPGVISKGSDNAPEKSGMAAAALISGGVGAVMMMISHHISDTNKGFETILHKTIGGWIPGAVIPINAIQVVVKTGRCCLSKIVSP